MLHVRERHTRMHGFFSSGDDARNVGSRLRGGHHGRRTNQLGVKERRTNDSATKQMEEKRGREGEEKEKGGVFDVLNDL